MGKREQVSLKPGRYGSEVLTRDDIAKYVQGTKAMISAGYSPVLFLEHPLMGSEEGAPKSKRETEIERLLGAAGWAEDVKLGDDGAAVFVLDVTDSAIARKLDEGSIKFTSPELRPMLRRGDRIFENVFSHVALTHKPRNPEQSEFREPAMQFSLDDWEPIMADEDDKKDESTEAPESPESQAEPEKPENPDLPSGDADGSKGERMQRLEAITAHLAELGVMLPDDTKDAEIDVVLDRILTGLMTAAAAKKQAEPEEPETPEDNPPPVVEQQGMMQYSIDDDIPNKLLKKSITAEHAEIVRKLDRMIERNKITPAAKTALLGCTGAMQFNADGDLLPSLTIGQVVDLLDNSIPEGMTMTEDDVAQQFSTADHPDGERHYKGDAPVSAEQAEKIVDEQEKVLGGMFRQKK